MFLQTSYIIEILMKTLMEWDLRQMCICVITRNNTHNYVIPQPVMCISGMPTILKLHPLHARNNCSYTNCGAGCVQ